MRPNLSRRLHCRDCVEVGLETFRNAGDVRLNEFDRDFGSRLGGPGELQRIRGRVNDKRCQVPGPICSGVQRDATVGDERASRVRDGMSMYNDMG
jgi:hypothetical protein